MQTDVKLAANRRAQDRIMAERHHQWDVSAQDNHAKSERAHFAVVGEGTRSALDAYRVNYSLIDWES